jgi:hypothetical protein
MEDANNLLYIVECDSPLYNVECDNSLETAECDNSRETAECDNSLDTAAYNHQLHTADETPMRPGKRTMVPISLFETSDTVAANRRTVELDHEYFFPSTSLDIIQLMIGPASPDSYAGTSSPPESPRPQHAWSSTPTSPCLSSTRITALAARPDVNDDDLTNSMDVSTAGDHHSPTYSTDSLEFDFDECSSETSDSMYPDSPHDNKVGEDVIAHEYAEGMALAVERLCKSAYIETAAIVGPNKQNPTRREQCSIFQYIITHWTVMLGNTAKSLKNFTLYDFANQGKDGSFRIRRYLATPDRGLYIVLVSAWMQTVLQYYVETIRPLWVSKETASADIYVVLPFEGYTEPTALFLVNSHGGVNININKAVVRYQKKGGGAPPTHRLSRASISNYGYVVNRMSTIMAEQAILTNKQKPQIADLFPITMTAKTQIPSEKSMTRALMRCGYEKPEATKESKRYYWKMTYRRMSIRVDEVIECFRHREPSDDDIELACNAHTEPWRPLKTIQQFVHRRYAGHGQQRPGNSSRI